MTLAISPFEADRRLLTNLLNRSGSRALGVSSRQEALPFLREGSVPVVICDSELPDGTWQELLNDLALLEHPPLMIVTSRLADDALWAEVLNLGGFDLLMRPFDAGEVIRVVGQAWRQAERGSSKLGIAGA
jgi:DNA-binding response OmpR family regulator